MKLFVDLVGCATIGTAIAVIGGFAIGLSEYLFEEHERRKERDKD